MGTGWQAISQGAHKLCYFSLQEEHRSPLLARGADLVACFSRSVDAVTWHLRSGHKRHWDSLLANSLGSPLPLRDTQVAL